MAGLTCPRCGHQPDTPNHEHGCRAGLPEGEPDVLDEAWPWLQVCGACDAGLSMSCSCPRGDYRSVLLRLVNEVVRLRTRVWPPSVT